MLTLYLYLIIGVLSGWGLGRVLPREAPTVLGRLLFMLGVPISIFAFLRRTKLDLSIWLAPLTAWMAILLGLSLATILLNIGNKTQKISLGTQGSFLLAATFGNTGYLGYPVVLNLVGEKYFGWALFYDLIGTTLGAYGLGVILAAILGGQAYNVATILSALIKNPALWSLVLGLIFHKTPFPDIVDLVLYGLAWFSLSLSIILIGMRLGNLRNWSGVRLVVKGLTIKMLIVPLLLGLGLSAIGLKQEPLLIMVLQMANPPAFATLVLAETYNLDQDLSVTAITIGSITLLFTIPIWIFLFK